METLTTDVLVIGGGLAGMAAIEASKYGLSVTLVDKGRFARSGSTPTSGGSPHAHVPIDLGGSPEDTIEAFIKDNVLGGDYLGDQEVIGIMAREGAQRILDLERFGVHFVKEEGRFKTSRTLGESHPRVGTVIGEGRGLMDGLRSEVLRRGVRVVENTSILHLLKLQGEVRGALAINRRAGVPMLFQARAVILGAGGATGLYGLSSANFLVNGDSYGLALKAGASLKNMEFQEFTLIPAPFGRPISTAAIKGITAAGAKFYNEEGERFLERYSPDMMELSLRSRLTVAVARELAQGHQALLDATVFDKPVSHLPKVERAGFNWRKERIPYIPAVHDSLGGIVTDSEGRTDIPGLYAVGEAAGFQGAFGADRAGGAILACLVFARRAGAASALALIGQEGKIPPQEGAMQGQAREYWEKLRGQADEGRDDPKDLLTEIRRLSDRCIGVIRNREGLEYFLRQGKHLFRQSGRLMWKNPSAIIEAIETSHLVLTGCAVALCALERQESRGHHFREDMPRRNDAEELRWIMVCGESPENLRVRTVPVPFDRYPLKPSSWGEGKQESQGRKVQ
jgi:succinate dehydrogenase / fumarate reductase, flavoprotein subunit